MNESLWSEILRYLAWLSIPVLVVAVIDDWLLRPQRQAIDPNAADPPLMRLVYAILPVLLLAALLHVLLGEQIDFSLALVLIAAVSAVVLLLDRLLLAGMRARAAARAGQPANAPMLPITVDYARSFLPVAIIVLVIRSFIFEPFQIPSDSMMPTLQAGDFIIVNKFAYGLRLPVTNQKVLETGQPQRGDIVVFRYPRNPSENYVKRLVGLPGDRVQVVSDQLIINGTPVASTVDGRYDDGCYHDFRISTEVLGTHTHKTLSCLTSGSVFAAPGSTCDRQLDFNYVCDESSGALPHDANDYAEDVVPAGNYLMIGDNRDNSSDGRVWGYVPEGNLIGRATFIWFNFSWHRTHWIKWGRIGHRLN